MFKVPDIYKVGQVWKDERCQLRKITAIEGYKIHYTVCHTKLNIWCIDNYEYWLGKTLATELEQALC
jgi:hypothetical protein